MLRLIKAAIAPHRLSITALAGWNGKPGFAKLQDQVDGIAVMFYDLEADDTKIRQNLNRKQNPWIYQRKIGRISQKNGLYIRNFAEPRSIILLEMKNLQNNLTPRTQKADKT